MSDSENIYTNSGYSMLWFLVITLGYFVVKTYAERGSSNDGEENIKTKNTMYTIIYLLLIIIGEFFINLYLTIAMCGYVQIGTAFNFTVVPWVLVFLTLASILMIFPGWLKPFSNTFGYLVTVIVGINSTMNKILKSSNKDESIRKFQRIFSINLF